MKLPIHYINGNYQVTIATDGTKTRTTPDTHFTPTRVETVDINISNHCTIGCPYCYISASPTGEHGNLHHTVLSGIPNGTELAINYAEHPDLPLFLQFNNSSYIINLTINEKSLANPDTVNKVQQWLDKGYIHGVGISTNTGEPTPLTTDNIVYHTINGITSPSVIADLIKRGQKVLILGYKPLGRASTTLPNFDHWQQEVHYLLNQLFDGILSFDNLALDQLEVQQMVSSVIWQTHYMGEEGSVSLYLDLVKQSYAVSSTTSDNIFPIGDKSFNQVHQHIKELTNGN